VRFKEVLSRITGISSPVFGVSWTAPEAERAVARRVIAVLEDKRVLYVDSELEVPRHCVEAILQIREALTRELGALESSTEIAQSLRAMRLACRKFLDVIGPSDGPYQKHGGERGHYASWTFNAALGALRGVFGIHVARIAAAYGLDVEDDLGAILPEPDDEPKERSNKALQRTGRQTARR